MDFTFSADQEPLRDVGAHLPRRRGAERVRARDGRRRARLHRRRLEPASAALGWTGVARARGARRPRARPRRHGGRARGDGPASRSPARTSRRRSWRRWPARRLGADRAARTRSPPGRDAGPSRSRSSATATRSTACGPAPGARARTGCSPALKPLVLDGHTADWVIVVARTEEGLGSFLHRGARPRTPVPDDRPDAQGGAPRARRHAGRAARPARRPHRDLAPRRRRRRRDARRRAGRRVRGGAASWRSSTRRCACSSTGRSRRSR